VAAVAATTPTPEQAAVHSADQAWWWNGTGWQPSSDELRLDAGLRARLRLLALPLLFTPGMAWPLALLALTPILLAAVLIGASNGYAGWPGLLVVMFVPPFLALPLVLARLLLGFRINQYRHDLTSSTFLRSRGRPEVSPRGGSIAGRPLHPQVDAGRIHLALMGLTWAEVDHGAAGAVVLAIRDGAGGTVYQMRSPIGKTAWLSIVAALALLSALAVSQGSLLAINGSRAASEAAMQQARLDISALAAALPCAANADRSTRECYRIVTTSVLNLARESGPRGGCDVRLGDRAHYHLVAACSLVPPVDSRVSARQWNQKVVDVGYEGQQFDTFDSPTVAYASAQTSRDAIDAYRWIWILSPILYALMVIAAQIAWRRRGARRHANLISRSLRPSRP
jgi:hypothetical protein